jgi:hypothetical protein
MTVRTILSARGARRQVEAWVNAWVRCGVFLLRARGGAGEAELGALAGTLAELAPGAVGVAHARELASSEQLAAQARAAQAELATGDPQVWLEALGASLSGGFKRDALLIGYRGLAVAGALEPGVELAFRRLGTALGLSDDEVLAVAAMARGTGQAAQRGRDTGAIEAVQALVRRGWTEPFETLRAAGVGVQWFDAAAELQGQRSRLRLDLDASERVLHLHLQGERTPWPHVICLYGGRFTAVLACVEAAAASLTAGTVPQLLADLGPLCEALFVERDGKLVQLTP